MEYISLREIAEQLKGCCSYSTLVRLLGEKKITLRKAEFRSGQGLTPYVADDRDIERIKGQLKMFARETPSKDNVVIELLRSGKYRLRLRNGKGLACNRAEKVLPSLDDAPAIIEAFLKGE